MSVTGRPEYSSWLSFDSSRRGGTSIANNASEHQGTDNVHNINTNVMVTNIRPYPAELTIPVCIIFD